jgi:predicted ArsR family transcriptional regulator
MKQHSIRKHVSELFEEGTTDVMVKNAGLSSTEQQIVTQGRAKNIWRWTALSYKQVRKTRILTASRQP